MVRALWPHLPPSRESRVNHWKPSLTAAHPPDPCQASVSAKRHSCHAIHTHTLSPIRVYIFISPCLRVGRLADVLFHPVLCLSPCSWHTLAPGPRAPGQGKGAEVGSGCAVVVFFSFSVLCCFWGIIFQLQNIFGILLEDLFSVSFAFCWSCFACIHIHFFMLLMLHMYLVKMFNNHSIQYRVALTCVFASITLAFSSKCVGRP